MLTVKNKLQQVCCECGNLSSNNTCSVILKTTRNKFTLCKDCAKKLTGSLIMIFGFK